MLDQHAIVQKSPFAPKWYDRTFVVIALLIFLWPIGVYALIRNRRMGGFGKFAVFSFITLGWLALFGGAGYGGYYLYKHPDVARRYIDNLHIANLKLKPTPTDPTIVTDPKTLLDNQNDLKVTDNQTDLTKQIDLNKTSGNGSNDAVLTPPISVPVPVTPIVKDPEAAKNDVKVPVNDTPPATTKIETPVVTKIDAPPAPVTPVTTATPVKVEPDATPVVVVPPVQPAIKTQKAEEAPVVKAPPAPNTEELDAQADALKKRAADIAAAKTRQVAKFETAITDYMAATNLDPAYQDIEAAFRKDLVDNYKSDRFDEAQFNVYFTTEYIKNYNGQLKRRQTALAQYHKILLDGDTALHNNTTKLAAEFEQFNQKLADAGKAKIEFPAADVTAQDPKLEALRSKLSSLPERLITIEDLRAKIGSKADVKAPVETAALPSRIAIEGQPEVRVAQPNQGNQVNAAETVDLSRVGPPNTGRPNLNQQPVQLPPPSNVQTPAAPARDRYFGDLRRVGSRRWQSDLGSRAGRRDARSRQGQKSDEGLLGIR